MTMQITSTTLRTPRDSRRGPVLAVAGLVVVAAVAVGVLGWQARDDGDTAPVPVRVEAGASGAAGASEAGPGMGGLAEMYQAQQAATSGAEDAARGGLAELYAEQEAAARSREGTLADPCQLEGARPDFC